MYAANNFSILIASGPCQATGLPPAGWFVVGDGLVVGPKQ